MDRLFGALRAALPYLPGQQVSRREFLSELAAARASQWDSHLLALRTTTRLRDLLKHAYAEVPYYRRLWSSIGFDPNSVGTWSDPGSILRSLPILEKQVLKRHYTDLFSDHLPPVALSYSSGSRGATTIVVRSRHAKRLGIAAFKRLYDEAYLPQRPIIANLFPWPSPPVSRRFREDWSVTWLEVGMPDYCAQARNGKPIKSDAITAPPLVLRQTVDALGVMLRDITKALINCYERLDLATRAHVESTSHLRVFDLYAASEMAPPIAFECRAHSGLHVNDDYVIVEIVDERNRPMPPGGTGQVLVTDLINHAMPLIRYRIGDMATASAESCSCGRALSLLAGIDGRAGDTIRLHGGQELPAKDVIDRLSAELPPEFRLIQDDFHRFTLVFTSRAAPHIKAELQSIVEGILGQPIELQISYEEDAGMLHGAKHRRFMSRLPRPIHIPTTRPPAGNDGAS